MRISQNTRKCEPTRIPKGQEETIRNEIGREAQRYLHAKVCLGEIKKHTQYLTTNQFKRLRKQAISGDITGAYNALHRIIQERA